VLATIGAFILTVFVRYPANGRYGAQSLYAAPPLARPTTSIPTLGHKLHPTPPSAQKQAQRAHATHAPSTPPTYAYEPRSNPMPRDLTNPNQAAIWLVSVTAFATALFTLWRRCSPQGEQWALMSAGSEKPSTLILGRREALNMAAGLMLSRAGAAHADNAAASQVAPAAPQLRLSDDELYRIVKGDIIDRQFLVSAVVTRSIYTDDCTFTDEIDTYPIDKWVKGTQALFVASGSHIDLVGDVKVTDTEVEFRFDETLMFNVPFRPVVPLTGRVVMQRDPMSGLITSYREYWDQDIGTVLKSTKF